MFSSQKQTWLMCKQQKDAFTGSRMLPTMCRTSFLLTATANLSWLPLSWLQLRPADQLVHMQQATQKEIIDPKVCWHLCLQIVEGETRLKQQQNLYEAVRADRNLYSKNLIQAQDEIQEMKRKFQIMVTSLLLLTSALAGSLLRICNATLNLNAIEHCL